MGFSFECGLRCLNFSVDPPSKAAVNTYDPTRDPEFQAAVSLRTSGQLARAGIEFERLAEEARRQQNYPKEARLLLAKAGVQLHQFAYRDAHQTYQQLLNLAATLGDTKMSGAAFVNLAEIYIQLSDLPAAERRAESAVQLLRTSAPSTILVRAELQLASIRAALHQDRAADQAYRDAIDQASNLVDPKTESFVWLIYGQALAGRQDYTRAEAAYLTAYRLSVMDRDPTLDTIRAKLAELYRLTNRSADGLELLDSVLERRSPEELGFASYQVFFNRAQMLAALCRNQQALEMYRSAVRAATSWRQKALPGEVANAGSVQTIHRIYAVASDFLADLAIREHNLNYAREALEILATNRAADMREARTLAWHKNGRLPPRYYQLLEKLRTEEANLILDSGNKQGIEASARQTRADLSLLETQLALDSEKSVNSNERFGPQKTLKDIQQSLSDSDALFTFNVGPARSWLWAIGRQSFAVYKLPDERTLERQSSAWATEIRTGRPGTNTGIDLAKSLFSQVSADVLEKHNWLVVNDGKLFMNVPMAALPELPASQAGAGLNDAKPLIANHTVRYVNSEFSLGTGSVSNTQSYLFAGIGDPIYNVADSRYEKGKMASFSRTTYASTVLARLVGSGREIKESAAEFPKSEVLMGQFARPDTFRSLLDANPTVIHLAVHVVSPANRPEEAALALSLGRDSLPELLTPELIATYHVPGSLVVMSGCNSQQGKAVPGVGVRGLSRAWLMAGASAVIASTWPMPDEDGKFFRSFYRHFVAESGESRSVSKLAAAALADAQNEMRVSAGLQREPAFWAAYSVISKE